SRLASPMGSTPRVCARAGFSSPRGSRTEGARPLCLWIESVWLLLGGGPRHRSGRSVWVFLAPGRFAAKTPAHEWLSLDSLVRIDTFQWVTRLEAGIIFPRAFSASLEVREGERAVEPMRKRRIVRGKLNLFSVFLKWIVVGAVPFGR